MDVSRLHRVLRLVTLLQSGATWGADELAKELAVSRRTLFRDLNMLRAAGIPYLHDPRTGYRIAANFFLPPVNLKVTEAMGLMALAKSAAAQRDQPLLNPAVEAVRKLMAMMPPPLREVCSEMMERVSVRPAPASRTTPRDTDHYAAIQQAIDQRRGIQMRYTSLFDGEGEIALKLRPYHLHFAVRAWYVIGYSELHKQIRTFKLSRIQEMQITKQTFTLRKPFDIDEYLGNAWQFIREGKLHRVVLEFAPKVAANVAEVRWHPTQKTEMLDDGRCRVCFEVDGLIEITWWLLGYGDQVLVKQPAELAQRLQTVYRAALAQYTPRLARSSG